MTNLVIRMALLLEDDRISNGSEQSLFWEGRNRWNEGRKIPRDEGSVHQRKLLVQIAKRSSTHQIGCSSRYLHLL